MKDKNQDKTDSPSKRKQLAKIARKIADKTTRAQRVKALQTPAQKRRRRKAQ